MKSLQQQLQDIGSANMDLAGVRLELQSLTTNGEIALLRDKTISTAVDVLQDIQAAAEKLTGISNRITAALNGEG